MKFNPAEMTDEKIDSCLAFAARILSDCTRSREKAPGGRRLQDVGRAIKLLKGV